MARSWAAKLGKSRTAEEEDYKHVVEIAADDVVAHFDTVRTSLRSMAFGWVGSAWGKAFGLKPSLAEALPEDDVLATDDSAADKYHAAQDEEERMRRLKILIRFSMQLLQHADNHGVLTESRSKCVWGHYVEGKSYREICDDHPEIPGPGVARLHAYRGIDDVRKHFLKQPFLDSRKNGWYAAEVLPERLALETGADFSEREHVRLFLRWLAKDHPKIDAFEGGPDNREAHDLRERLCSGFIWTTERFSEPKSDPDEMWQRVRNEL